ncbi:MAG: TIGR02147 family protein, partial [Bdellovibrionota bacterium]
NPQYSLRAFAKSLEIDSSTLSALIRRKRPLTAKTAQRLIANLGITDPSHSQSLLLGVLGQSDEAAPEYQQLDIEAAEVISSWEHFAIRSLLQLDGYRPNTKQIARRLNIPHGITLEALNRMARLGLVVQQGEIWLDTGKNLATPVNSVPNAALRGALRQYMVKAIDSLEKDPLDSRDMSGITMAIAAKKVPEARKLILDFRRRLCAFLEDGQKNSVYRLNVQLFPLALPEDN